MQIVKYKHALCHSFNYFESGTQAIDTLFMSQATKYLQYYKVQSQRTNRK